MIKISKNIRKIALVVTLFIGFTSYHWEHHRYFHALQIGQIIEQAEIIMARRTSLKALKKSHFASHIHILQHVSYSA